MHLSTPIIAVLAAAGAIAAPHGDPRAAGGPANELNARGGTPPELCFGINCHSYDRDGLSQDSKTKPRSKASRSEIHSVPNNIAQCGEPECPEENPLNDWALAPGIDDRSSHEHKSKRLLIPGDEQVGLGGIADEAQDSKKDKRVLTNLGQEEEDKTNGRRDSNNGKRQNSDNEKREKKRQEFWKVDGVNDASKDKREEKRQSWSMQGIGLGAGDD